MWCNKVKDKDFENILEDCLERLMVRGETVEDCLNAYPQQAAALKPLLHISLMAKNAAGIEPRPEFKASARYQFRTALQEAAPRKTRLFPAWRFRWATALTAILFMLMAGSGLVVASSTSMPNNPLYSVKLAVEQMQLNLTFSDLGKANLYAEFSDRRVSEIMHMAQKGDASRVMAGTDLLGNQLAMIANLTTGSDNTRQDNWILSEDAQSALEADKTPLTTPGASFQPPKTVTLLPPTVVIGAGSQDSFTYEGEYSELFNLLLQDYTENSAALRDLLATAPESVKSALLEAISALEADYSNVLNAFIE